MILSTACMWVPIQSQCVLHTRFPSFYCHSEVQQAAPLPAKESTIPS